MEFYTVSEAAAQLHVTPRTLRHWDEVGLLVPSERSAADYRLYSLADLDRALEILVYREVGIPLNEISSLLARSSDRRKRLRRQREILLHRIDTTASMVRGIDALLSEDTMTTPPRPERIFGIDDSEWAGWQHEAESRWGNTPEWEAAQRTQASMTEDNWRDARDEHEAFVEKLAAAHDAGITPGSEEARRLVDEHRATIARWYEVTVERQVLLGRLYVSDDRFNGMYRGHAQYLADLIEAEARRQGIDPDTAEWTPQG